jgi:lipid-A-disaccharide synthase
MVKKEILIVCGESSGDLLASVLAKNILKLEPQIKISAVGGNLLRQAGAQIFYDIKDISVFGLFDALKKLPKFLALKKLILGKIKDEKPDAIILVDFSGFNLRLAKRINKSITTIYYVSPQVWASRQGRIKTINKYIHRMIVLFKFEEEFYKKYDIDVDFAGHPLLDIVKPSITKKEFLNKFNLSDSKTTIALLPGSRNTEIKNILPVMLEASTLINKSLGNVQFVIAKSPQVSWDIYNNIVGEKGGGSQREPPPFLDLKIIEDQTYNCLDACDFALVASGTATLETAILQKPFVIIYKMNILNYLLYRPQVKVPFIGIVNIVANKKIIPEFIQFKATPKDIAKQVLYILKNPSEIERIKSDLKQITSLLGSPGASSRAAQIVLNLLK